MRIPDEELFLFDSDGKLVSIGDHTIDMKLDEMDRLRQQRAAERLNEVLTDTTLSQLEPLERV